MTPEEINREIALACGWTVSENGSLAICGKNSTDGCFPPDYYNDLNAIHEAEKILNDEINILEDDEGFDTQLGVYIGNLELIVSRICAEEDVFDRTIRANASQRAEAFVKTINKWKEK